MGLLTVTAPGLGTLTRVARDAGPDISKAWRSELRKAGAPMVADAKARYEAGPWPLRHRAAKTVRFAVLQNGVALQVGGKPWSMAMEFGTKRTETRKFDVKGGPGRGAQFGVVRHINYVAQFGAWTGNRHTLDDGDVSGHAALPAAAAGRDAAVTAIGGVIDNFLDTFAKAA